MNSRSTSNDLKLALRSLGIPLLLLWAVFVASLPFYIGDSGKPQPGNAVLFILLPAAYSQVRGRLPLGARRTLRPLFWFTIWVGVVNYAWALINWKFNVQDYVVHPIYYVFNSLVLITTLMIHERHGERFLRLTAYVVIALVMFQVLASSALASADARGTLFFNNPNQLGYYSLISACLIALLQRHLKIQVLLAGFGLLGCAYLSLVSASRAATAGIAILLMFQVFSNPKLILAGSLAAIIATNVGPLARSIDLTERKQLLERDPNESFVEERGYDRLWNFKQHLLLGAGEGDLTRFSPANRTHEIHSSVGTVVFSYGIVGLVLFVTFAWRLIRGAPVMYQLTLLPAFLYAIAHQGLRFSMFWILLGVFLACKPRPPPALRPPMRGPV
jgi:hypothetical protein